MAAGSADPHESSWELAEGDSIADGLTALKLLGGGLRYEAHLAWSDPLQSLVVVKLVRPALVDDERTLRGLGAEVDLLERLRHPVLVRSFGARTEGERPYVVLEHLEGPRLSTLLRRYGPLLPEQLLPLGLQLCAAAHYLAEEEVVHLDIKPSNIIMGAPARLIDLSVARTLEQCRRQRSAVGTDAYMAPEQCLPHERPALASPADVWGIGVTLYEAATGRRPFPKGDPDAEDPARRWPQLTAPPATSDRLPESLVPLVSDCLRQDPDRRPSPAAIGAGLERGLAALSKPWVSKLKPRPPARR
ncbi:MAG TPA: serine/threonine-protein kinase [Thermoleophilaceae bacterium]|nr:serine/threonine-protein kinase [Thermoleophilaceae bacterium]